MKKKILILAVLVPILAGCIGKVDWNQGEDFEARPAWSFDLFYARLKGEDFYVQNQPVTELHDTIPMKVFKIKQIKDGLQKLVFYFDVQNPFPTRFTYHVEWARGSGVVITSFADTIAPGNGNQAFHHEFRYTIIKDSLPEIVLTEQMFLTLRRLDTTDIRNDEREFTVKSKADFYALMQ